MTKLGIKVGTKTQSKTDTAHHLVVRARAGTGKSTTLLEGVRFLKGLPTTITPSPQQQAIWDALKQSPASSSVGFVAFNKAIATELQNRVPAGCAAMTMHSMGFKAINAAGLLGGGRRLQVSEYRVDDLIAKALGEDRRKLRKDKPVLIGATKRLVSLAKMNLTDPTPANLAALADHYDVETDKFTDEVFALVPTVLDMCRDVAADGQIDFDDMVWLPVVLDLPVFKYDILCVDEVQDLNRCQQFLAKKAGRRLVLVGDDRQAIYGFAGADSESLNRMIGELGGKTCGRCGYPWEDKCTGCGDKLAGPVGSGCTVLPLTVTRRCGRAIVAEARKIVSDFEAHESNEDGLVRTAVMTGQVNPRHYQSFVQDGDMVLCRANAPLVSECFKFLKMGRKASIFGRDVAQALVSTITKLKATDVTELIARLADWQDKETEKELAKKHPSDARTQAIHDRHDCILCFYDGEESVTAVIEKIERVFTADPDAKGIRLSSIHRSKGLESDNVFLLQPKGSEVVPDWLENKPAWERTQATNLLYVAVTRARKVLTYVS